MKKTKKKIDNRDVIVIKNINDDNIENAVVAKNRMLLSLRASKFNVLELQLIDIYLGLIDSSDRSFQKIELTKMEIERMLGIKKLHRDILDKALENLQCKIVIWEENHKNGDKEIHRITLLKTKSYYSESGEVVVTLECIDPDARDYIYTGDGAKYLKYRLSEILAFKGKYPYVLYQYLLDNRFRHEIENEDGREMSGTWIVSTETLKDYLGCGDMKTSAFTQNVLRRAKIEIEEKTPLRYSISPIKRGKNIEAFSIRILEYPTDNKRYDVPVSRKTISYEEKKAQLERDFMRMNGDPDFAENKMREFSNRAEYYDCLANKCKKYTEK